MPSAVSIFWFLIFILGDVFYLCQRLRLRLESPLEDESEATAGDGWAAAT
jgi:hypothetical protein